MLILPDSGEPAEAWFETITELSSAGYVVWTLEWEAFGGSGRRVGPHDMAHAESPSAGARAIAALTTQVIRPETDRPLILLGSGDSAATVVMALQAGAPAAAAILSAPTWGEVRPSGTWEGLALRLRLGRLPSPEWRPWSREESEQNLEDMNDPWRGRVTHGWRLANPDLRQSGLSLGWRAMQGQARQMALEAPGRSTRMLILTTPADQTASVLCQGLWECERVTEPATAAAPHLAADPTRRPWVEQIAAFIAKQTTP
ncbi:MAG: hypothetical protein Q7V15_06585 [Phenylobacterium sp.]|uniref:hypothetical protein n=1 Tax=Phenylobacterium sp. TaxID=1871053 RepID=UPI0027165461|nr:hypothetical protein [Phenylobacterium sp.]MDO8901004.1 hypothetical protein [Phenylobacterium sp.]